MGEKRPIYRVLLPKRSDSVIDTHESDTHPDRVRAMADRISRLPGISSLSLAADSALASRRYYVESASAREASADGLCLFAVIDPAGRVSLDVSPAIQDEILRGGWGEMKGGHIVTFAPRDHIEVTVLWRVILMAYFDLREPHKDCLVSFSRGPAVSPVGARAATEFGITRGAFY
jgi:hypothetical protein